MNRIEDERIKFYLKHEARIREWAGLEAEVRQFVDRFYRSLEGDLDVALRSGRCADNGVEVFLSTEPWPDWPGLGLRRQDWPKGDVDPGNVDPDVRLEWKRSSARFSTGGHLVCGVRTTVKQYREPFTKESRPAFPLSNSWLPAYKKVDPPDDRFWEGDNLKRYRTYLVETIFEAWRDLAPLVDEAVFGLDSRKTSRPTCS